MSNIVFIPNIDLGKSQERQESNTQVYQYSIDSWKSWCDKNDVYYEDTDNREDLIQRIKDAGFK